MTNGSRKNKNNCNHEREENELSTATQHVANTPNTAVLLCAYFKVYAQKVLLYLFLSKAFI